MIWRMILALSNNLKESIDMSNLSNGVYLLQVKHQNEIIKTENAEGKLIQIP